MNSTNERSVFSYLMVFVLTVAILAGQSMFVLAIPATGAAAGEITVTGTSTTGEKPFVLVNGDAAFTGRTFFSNGTISTPDSSSASINFGKIGRINLGPGSILTLTVSETNISGTLSAGNIRVMNGDGVGVKIDTPDDSITNEGTTAGRFTVSVADNKSSVGAEKGLVRYNKGQSTAAGQDDDDDDNHGIWVPVIVIGGAVGAVLLYFALRDDDDDVVSPVR